MPLDVTILQRKINGLKEAFDNGHFADALSAAVNTGNGLMQQRIFTQNEDIEGQSFGQYVGKKRKVRLTTSTNKRLKAITGLELTSYQRKRANSGHQINPKNLEFTGGLRRTIEPQVENERAVTLAFNTDEAAKIARGQENQITNIRNGQKGTTKGSGIKIFRLNQTEKEQVIEQGAELITKIINDGISDTANTK